MDDFTRFDCRKGVTADDETLFIGVVLKDVICCRAVRFGILFMCKTSAKAISLVYMAMSFEVQVALQYPHQKRVRSYIKMHPV